MIDLFSIHLHFLQHEWRIVLFEFHNGEDWCSLSLEEANELVDEGIVNLEHLDIDNETVTLTGKAKRVLIRKIWFARATSVALSAILVLHWTALTVVMGLGIYYSPLVISTAIKGDEAVVATEMLPRMMALGALVLIITWVGNWAKTKHPIFRGIANDNS